jgi:hypothetical protein
MMLFFAGFLAALIPSAIVFACMLRLSSADVEEPDHAESSIVPFGKPRTEMPVR